MLGILTPMCTTVTRLLTQPIGRAQRCQDCSCSSLLFPFHCWRTVPHPAITRFTVGRDPISWPPVPHNVNIPDIPSRTNPPQINIHPFVRNVEQAGGRISSRINLDHRGNREGWSKKPDTESTFVQGISFIEEVYSPDQKL